MITIADKDMLHSKTNNLVAIITLMVEGIHKTMAIIIVE
jgi:hypothetical protein